MPDQGHGSSICKNALESTEAIIGDCFLRVWNIFGCLRLQEKWQRAVSALFGGRFGPNQGHCSSFCKKALESTEAIIEECFLRVWNIFVDYGSKKSGNGPFQPFSGGVLGPTRGTVRAFTKRPWNQLKQSLENVF